MISIAAIASAWTAWFHASEPPYTIALFRALFGVLLVAWLGYKFLRSTWLRKWWAIRRS